MVELELEEPQQLEAMCEKLLANPLVEDYEVELLDASSSRAGEAGANGVGG